ncbi:MAG: aldose 1-epimerase [Bacteroidetes bacterium]|nr:aldose 1-epimerase [Bacteroidota bacterium]
MLFTILINDKEQFPSIKMVDTVSLCEVEVFCFGGILNEFSIEKNNQRVNVIDAYYNVADAIEQRNTWFKSCKLSPFACRLESGKYNWNNINYTIEKFYLGNNAIHGLVYDAVYEIVKTEATETDAMIELQYTYNATDSGYPFNFTTNILYKLEANNKLTITSTIHHNNNQSIPYCEGWHPYFKLDEPIDNCTLQFNANELLAFDENLIPTGNVLSDDRFFKPKKLKDIKLDNCYKLKENEMPICVLESKNIKLTITAVQSYPYLQVFIPDHRNNIAIENLSAAPNAFNNKMGLSILDPNKKYVFEMSYKLV